MKRQFFHSALTLFTLCVMTLTSTGFTAVVGYCSMTHESKCCCDEPAATTDAPPPGVSITEPVVSCFTQSVAGGLNEITATLHTDVLVQSVALDVIPADQFSITRPDIHHILFSAAGDDTSPPGVPIYIRVNSFLI
jgi:hypothetical protein